MPAGRPTEYSDKTLTKAKEYLENLPKDEVVHSIEGLADYLDITRATIYDWASQEGKQEFSYVVEAIRHRQAKSLINKGLKNEFNAKLTGLMLSKHGYKEQLGLSGEREGEPIKINTDLASAIDKIYGGHGKDGV